MTLLLASYLTSLLLPLCASTFIYTLTMFLYANLKSQYNMVPREVGC